MNRLGLKIIVSALALFLVFHKVGLSPLLGVIKDTEWVYLYLSLVIYFFAQGICALKWKILASPLGIILPLKEFITYYFIGMFFNLFLPTSMGGDISKCYYLVRKESSWRGAIFSVLGERVTGGISLVMILIIGSFFLQDYAPLIKMAALVRTIIAPIFLTPVFIVLFLTVILALAVLWVFLPPKAEAYFFPDHWTSLIRKAFAHEILKIFWQRPGMVFKVIGLGLFFQLLIIVIHILIAYSLGLTIPILYYFILYPIADLISFLPLTFNGVGLREWSYTYLLALIGIRPEKALGFSLLWFSILFSAGLMGGMVFLLGNFESPKRVPLIAEAKK